MEIGAVLRADLARTTASFLAHDHDLDEAITGAPLHGARVELRRIRATTRTFRSLFDSEWLREALAEVSWYQTLLGEVRDVDVTIAGLLRLETCRADDGGSAVLTALLVVERADAMRKLVAGRASPRHASATRFLEELVDGPPMRRRATSEAGTALPPVLERAWRNLRESGRVARRAPTELALHGVRLRATELRYASELAAPVLGGGALPLARACAKVQRRLGRHRDAIAAERWLLGAASNVPAAGPLASRLALDQKELAAVLEASWSKDLKRAKKAWRELSGGKRH